MSENVTTEFIKKPWLKKRTAIPAEIIEKTLMGVGGNEEESQANKYFFTARFKKGAELKT